MRNTLLFLCLLTTIAHAQWAKAPLQPPAHLNPNLYPANADARQEIAEAIGSLVNKQGTEKQPTGKDEALADVLWALLNSSEFIFNH